MLTPDARAFAWTLLFASAAVLGASATQAETRIHGELTAGYDSNPAQSHAGSALAFAEIAVAAAHRIHLDESGLTLGASGAFRDYAADNDSTRLTLSADWSRETAQGVGLLTLAVAGTLYRDALVPADERDEAALTLGYDHAPTARDTFGLLIETRRLDYLNASLPWSGRPGSNRYGRVPNRPERGNAVAAMLRDDWLSSLGFDATHHWSPRFATVFSLAAARCDSTVALESYARRRAALLIRVEPAAKWRLELGIEWARNRYDQAPQQQERDDLQRAAHLSLRRAFGRCEWFCGLDWLDNDSTLRAQSFRQQVTACGLAWSF